VHEGNKGYAIQVYINDLPKQPFTRMIQWVDHPAQSFILHWVTLGSVSFKARNLRPPPVIRSGS
jgi:hypothetical protein